MNDQETNERDSAAKPARVAASTPNTRIIRDGGEPVNCHFVNITIIHSRKPNRMGQQGSITKKIFTKSFQSQCRREGAALTDERTPTIRVIEISSHHRN